MTKNLWIAAVLAMALVVGGCNALGYLGYLVAPDNSERTVEPEFKDLPGTKVAVVVFADQNVLYEYQSVPFEIASGIGYELSKNVQKVQIVDSQRVLKYQAENLEWDSQDRTAIGKALGADYVLHVSLVEFTTSEPGSINLYRGRVTAEVKLYKVSMPEREACVKSWENIRVSFPEQEVVGQMNEDDRGIRLATEKVFADVIAKKFYKHKVKT